MAKQKSLRSVVERCRECGATSHETFLERIKGSKQYICDECAAEAAFFRKPVKLKGKSYPVYNDEYNDDFLFI